MQKARRHPDKSELRPLVSVWFQVLFTPLLGVLFTFPSRYWFTIGLSGVFSLTRWCWPYSDRISPAPPYSGYSTTILIFVYGTVTFYRFSFPNMYSYYSVLQLLYTSFGLFRVRSPLLSGITIVFFSSGYLDVSVPRVCLRFRRNTMSST